MLIDLTLKVTPRMVEDAGGNEKKALVGHLGTHFDVMDREFPLELAERPGVMLDVSSVQGRDISEGDIDWALVRPDIFVAFYTGFLQRTGYGSKAYFTEHPQLAPQVIERLLTAGVSIIGIDCAGIRRGREHTPTDQHCADHGVFVLENLTNLEKLAGLAGFEILTFPMNFSGMTGLPCRVVAKTGQ